MSVKKWLFFFPLKSYRFLSFYNKSFVIIYFLTPWHTGAERKGSCLGERLCEGVEAGWWSQALRRPVGSSRIPGVTWAHGDSNQWHRGWVRQSLWHWKSRRMTGTEKEELRSSAKHFSKIRYLNVSLLKYLWRKDAQVRKFYHPQKVLLWPKTSDFLITTKWQTSEEDLEPDLVRDMKTLSSLMMTRWTSLMALRSFFLDTSCRGRMQIKN